MAEEGIPILDEVRRGGYEFSFIATYNAYLPFYEDVVLRRLVNAGCRGNVLMMDAAQCANALAAESTRPRYAGRTYTLVPVKAGGAFHPKIIFMIGRDRGVLFVGSHNLTLSGLSHNRELTSRFEFMSDADEEDAAEMRVAWNFLRAWARTQPRELQATFGDAERFAKWLHHDPPTDADQAAESRFVSTMPEGLSLWEAVHSHLPKDIRRITVVAPFFDTKTDFLRRIIEELSPEQLIVGVEPSAVEIGTHEARLLPNTKFVDVECLREGKGYLHAKALLFEAANGEELLIMGSANASGTAWLATPARRNVEAVVLLRNTKRRSVAKELGLKSLAKQPALDEQAWSLIRSRKPCVSATPSAPQRAPLIAVETEDGFEIGSNDLDFERLPDVVFLGENSTVLQPQFVVNVEEHALKIEVPDAAARELVLLIKLMFSDGEERVAIVHHTFSLAMSAQTKRQKELRYALDNLDAEAPMLEGLLKIVERVIFDDPYTPARDAAPRSAAHAEVRTDSEDAPQTSFVASLADSLTARRRAQMISSGDLGLLLDALNRRLSENLEAQVTTTASYARSEESLIGTDDEEREEIDGVALAHSCRRKVGTLMRRMTRQLERAASAGDAGFEVVAQSAAVLGILHRLRELERQVTWLPRGETLIPLDVEWRFFLDAVRLLFSETSVVMTNALSSSQTRGTPTEVSVLVGLLLWLAWDCELDVRYSALTTDREEREQNLRGVSRLIALSSHLSGDAAAQQKASDAIKRVGQYREPDDRVTAWYDTHLGWMRGITAARIDSQPTGGEPRRTVAPGTIVSTFRAKVPRLFVAVESTGTSVRVIDFDKEKERVLYDNRYIATVTIPALV